MAVVIRLQGLAVTASSQDIRKFFGGLKIPDGGVHIIGGELEEAFIIFGSDEDARIAMTKSGGYIKGSPVSLILSSKTEMQNILEKSTMSLELDQRRMLKERTRHLDMDDLRGSRSSAASVADRRSTSRLGPAPSHQNQKASVAAGENERQLLLRGMPFSVTEKDIHKFFVGLAVDGIVLFKNSRGQNNGNGLVTFASKEDARNGLKKHKEYMGSRYVELYTPREWQQAFGEIPLGPSMAETFERRRSPQRSEKNPQLPGRSRSPLVTGPSTSVDDFCVLLDNLSYGVDKEDIKGLFDRARLEKDQILYLLDGNGKRTRSAFVLFNRLQDYREALDCDNKKFLNRYINVRPISREKMISLLEAKNSNTSTSERFEERPPYPADTLTLYDSEKICIYVKNLPFDVRKVEIMDFFIGFNVSEDSVILLHDHEGHGEALVVFQSEAEAMDALSLNGRRFLGSEVFLICISRSEMQKITEPSFPPRSSLREKQYPDKRSEAPYDTDLLTPMRNAQPRVPKDFETYARGSYRQQRDEDGALGGFGFSAHDGPTCIKLVNLPFNIKIEEVYDFCYGYKIIPGSASLQYDRSGASKGTATVVFESRQEALTAIDDLTGRPIGQRKIQLVFL